MAGFLDYLYCRIDLIPQNLKRRNQIENWGKTSELLIIALLQVPCRGSFPHANVHNERGQDEVLRPG
jgi:hypothetical protein